MSLLKVPKDKIYCNNCGCENHCGSICKRTEKGYKCDGGKEYQIEVCRQCSCKDCYAE